jgi:signal transduction histidine kinase
VSERKGAERDQAGREAARRILEAADEARRRLARDLHDGAQQKFVTAVINLQLAQAKFSSDPERAKRYLDAALDQSESGLAALRDFVSGVHPPILAHLGLNAAVESLADGFPIPVELDVTERRFQPALEESTYFFISEALTNVIKHAQASTATVEVRPGATMLTVEVRDDGIGGASLAGGGTGLLGLVDRVEILGGDFAFVSPPAGGTVIRGEMPLVADPV